MSETRTLLEISEDLIRLEETLYESGGDISDPEKEAAIDAWFETLEGERDQKLDNYAALIEELNLRSKARKQIAGRLATRAKQDEDLAKSLKDRLVYFFRSHGLKTVETTRYRLTRAKAGGRQPITWKVHPGKLPEDLVEKRTETQFKPRYENIFKALEEGEDLSEYLELDERSEYIRIS